MKIVLVDDHDIFRLGLRALLEKEAGMIVVGEAEDTKTGLEAVVQNNPDMALIDYSMPGISGLELMQTLKRRFPKLRIIILTASKSESVLSEALSLKADGLVLKQDASDELVQALRLVNRGEHFLSSSISPIVERMDNLVNLTKRERQVLRLISNGYRNREISDELNISIKTVDSHRTNLMRKLNLHNLVDLIEFANKSGILDSSI